MANAAAGDGEAFRSLFERHAATIRGFVRARADTNDVDDVLADTFATAWVRRNSFDTSRENALPWLLGIATKLVQKLRRERFGHQADPLLNDDRSDSAELGVREVDPGLHAALATLGEGEREILLLVAIGEMSVVEAARAAGISPVAARVRLFRARKKMSERISSQGDEYES
jgi:RNA polymerase sigma-70 factor (ECF subfamily)